jgi:release factor glutamine methyltransferase
MTKLINIFSLSRLETILLLDLLNVEPEVLYFRKGYPLSQDAYEKFIFKKNLLNKGYPPDYLLNRVKFLNFSIKVFPDVFIPRPETEEWLAKLRKVDIKTDLLIDLGCGSGIVSLALARLAKQVLAVDKSSRALANSNYNFKTNNQKNIISLQSHFFKNNLIDYKIKQNPNWWLVSNPPYVPGIEKTNISRNNLIFEPKEAIFSELDGLHFFRVTVKKLNDLKQKKKLPVLAVFEMDPRNILKADQLISHLFRYTKVWQDYQGHPRVLTACNNHLIFDKIEQSLLD